MQKIFITSSGTGVGKTLVTCALAKNLKRSLAVKPVISGFKINEKPNDISLLCAAQGMEYSKENIAKVNFTSFKKPLSPDMAARVEGGAVDIKKLISFTNKQISGVEYKIVETVGGVMVPLNKNNTTLEWIEKCADKVVLVAGSYLGSLSHTLSAYRLLKRVDVVIVTQNLKAAEPLYVPLKETIKSLENFISVPIIGLERIAGNDKAKIELVAKKLSGLNKILKIK